MTGKKAPRSATGMLVLFTLLALLYGSTSALSQLRIRNFGDDHYGQLGLGRKVEYLAPFQTPGIVVGIRAAAGGFHNLVVNGDSTVAAWGYNAFGQLGDGTETDRSSVAPVSGLSTVVSVAAGYVHSLALKNDTTVWAWGSNGSGRGWATEPQPSAIHPSR